ncbi:hypothetical protein PUN28_010817 [Cardiocondyla obscurior]|uniref:Uncharacterized protein n=1 Tax=Cardiocondyla obscurior TaxID=286306 RepID=A0AAW2FHW9_9HYME
MFDFKLKSKFKSFLGKGMRRGALCWDRKKRRNGFSRTVVHYSRRYVLPRDALSPSSLHVQVPLELEERIGWVLARRVGRILDFVHRHEILRKKYFVTNSIHN